MLLVHKGRGATVRAALAVVDDATPLVFAGGMNLVVVGGQPPKAANGTDFRRPERPHLGVVFCAGPPVGSERPSGHARLAVLILPALQADVRYVSPTRL